VTGALTAADVRWTLEPPPGPALRVIADEDLAVAALAEAQSYRLVARQALHALHDVSRRLDRAHAAYRRLHDEFKQLREDTAAAGSERRAA